MRLISNNPKYKTILKGILQKNSLAIINGYSVILILFIFMSCFPVQKQEQLSTERNQLFDNNWKFFLGDTITASEKDFNDGNWRSLDLPHDWSIEGKIDPKNPTGGSGGYFPAGIGWYRKTFSVPKDLNGKKVSIYFEGVYMNSEVFVNGKLLGVYPYGYSSFDYELTPYLDFGHENVIAVRVDNSQQLNCRWYSGSGIYRHVWLMVTDPVHVAQWGVSISTSRSSAPTRPSRSCMGYGMVCRD